MINKIWNGAASYRKRLVYVLFGWLLALPMRAQMLFTENIMMAIDSMDDAPACRRQRL